MKRLRFIAVCLAALMLLATGITAVAQSDPPRCVDDDGLLTSRQETEIAELLEALEEKYDYEYTFVIVTATSLDGESAEAYADDYFDYNDYGEDGVLLLICLESRDVHIATTGRGIKALSDREIDAILDVVAPMLSDEEYADAMRAYIDELDTYIAQENNTGSSGGSSSSVFSGSNVMIVLIVGLGIALIVVLSMKAKLKSVRPQTMARAYSANFALTRERDTFMHSRITKTAKPQNNSSGGGGSSTHRSSSGRSHGGGGRKF